MPVFGAGSLAVPQLVLPFAYRLRIVAGEVAMLEWTADSPAGQAVTPSL